MKRGPRLADLHRLGKRWSVSRGRSMPRFRSPPILSAHRPTPAGLGNGAGDSLQRRGPPVVTNLFRGRSRSTVVEAPAKPSHAPSHAPERTVGTFEQVHSRRLMSGRPQLHRLLQTLQ